MSRLKSPQVVGEAIKEIYEQKFGGKKRGRFQITRSQFRKLGGRKVLRDTFIDEVADECLDRGFVLIPVGDIIAIIEEGVVLNYRKVPKSVINPYIIEDEDEEEGELDVEEEEE
ncbi:MAG: hypothetical protein BA869_04890 [Desulfuromonadales bacterium C00003107]|jgi:hypothetical protein|nr:MAG: hypothetical protein BA869_04890 [Desulfuromonadales bacterium C00003107]